MGTMTEDQLIEAVLRIRAASAEALTAKQMHDALVAEGATVEFGQVKKAASKAAKRAPAGDASVPALPTPPPTGPSKKAEKKEGVQAAALKAGELAMFTALKGLHQERWMVAQHGEERQTKAFIDMTAASAISGGG